MKPQFLVMMTSLLLGTSAMAQEESALPPPAAPAPEPKRLQVTLPWTEPTGEGVGLGYGLGLFGGAFVQELRLKAPLHPHWGLTLRGLTAFTSGDEPSQFHLGGRLEFFGQSPVFFNIMRLYGGGGIQLFRPVSGVEDAKLILGNAGQFGFEFFMSHRYSFFLEVGGNSGPSRIQGATVLAGFHLFPF